MKIVKAELEELDKVTRLNIFNSMTGIKPGNLIGTRSKSGKENLAVFSSVVHLGSNPALIGFILRPHHDFRRDTYENILETGFYTINHIPAQLTKNAHYTSAKFEAGVSEFEECNLTPEYSDSFEVPYVKESGIKIGMKYLESIPIFVNNTSLIIGTVEEVHYPDNAVSEIGQLDLEKANSCGISGLDGYYKLQKIDSYPFVRTTEMPEFE
jgi:flavin reductase (DIM6/NTAB) family NADH-FMN oxidoreductase RutF